MKLIRYGKKGNEKPGVLLGKEKFADVSQYFDDFNLNFFDGNGLKNLKEHLENHELEEIDLSTVRLGPPVASIGKIICVGLNYGQHAAESGMELPSEPLIFFKATSSISGPNDTIIIPKGSTKTDWEVELAIVIGKKAQYVSEEDALDYVAGYVMHNDLSEREFQLEKGGQWVKGKSCDSFAPLGPYMATKDEITDPHNLDLWLKVNGKMMQNSNTSDLVFNVPVLVSYISQFMTLLPGDIISTGTPSGVGLGLNPPSYLNQGDVVELGIEGLGQSKQHVKNYIE